MSITTTGGIVHLPFADRPGFGGPDPEGIAVGHIDITGDASAGLVTGTLLADGGFLYRLELLQATNNFTTSILQADYITSHRWATDRSGLGATAFDLNWFAESVLGVSFQVTRPALNDLQMLRRFPIGRTDDVALQTLSSLTFETNINTAEYDFDWVFTYWKVEALYRPGFLASFYESPFIPLAVGP